jgi:hypothetical protein
VTVEVVGEDGTTAADIKAKAEGKAPEPTIQEAVAAAEAEGGQEAEAEDVGE